MADYSYCFAGVLKSVHVSSCRFRTAFAYLAVGISALTFSFDPFMVATFRHVHWIAVWDGVILEWMRMVNLYAVMIAHAIEVMIIYLLVRDFLA